MNADQAEMCLEMAVAAIKDQNWEKAERMLIKSIKLHDTD